MKRGGGGGGGTHFPSNTPPPPPSHQLRIISMLGIFTAHNARSSNPTVRCWEAEGEEGSGLVEVESEAIEQQ